MSSASSADRRPRTAPRSRLPKARAGLLVRVRRRSPRFVPCCRRLPPRSNCCILFWRTHVNRRDVLKTAIGGAAALWVPRLLGQQLTPVPLAGSVSLVDVGGANVVACQSSGGLVLVDSGPALTS